MIRLTLISLLIFNICWCVSSEEKVLGYGTQFGTVGNLQNNKVIGNIKINVLISRETPHIPSYASYALWDLR